MTYLVEQARIFDRFLHAPADDKTLDQMAAYLSHLTYSVTVPESYRERAKALLIGMMGECRSKMLRHTCVQNI